MNTSKIAAQLYTVRDFTKTTHDLEITLKKLKDIGYNAVQISAIGPINYSEVRQITESLDIKICATHSPYSRLTDDLKNLIEEHKEWNCKYIGLGSLPKELRGSYDNIMSFIEIMNPIAKEIGKNGLKFVYHNHKFEFEKYNNKNLFDLIAENTNRAEVGFLVDTYWVQAGGASPSTFINKYADRIDVVHLKDMQIMEDTAKVAEVGEGNIEWGPIITACEDADVKWYAVEQDTCYRDPFESLKMSFANIEMW